MAEYKLLKTEGRAKRAEFHTVHGTIQTPVFMNVGTAAALSRVQYLPWTYSRSEHRWSYPIPTIFMSRPGDKIVKQLGGLHKFMVMG